jgi:non-canonical purine NTP pyrophosphatase (RdgB/HAM1 family)
VSAYESVKYTGALTIDIDFVITEDVGLRLDALNGFPGPYCKPMLETIGVEGLANLVLKYDEEKGERNAMATCTLAVLETSVAFKYPLFVEKCVHVFEGAIAGKIVEPRGSVQHGKASWNACFEVAANDETDGATFGELSYEQQSKVSHRKKAIEGFLNSPLILGRLS